MIAGPFFRCRRKHRRRGHAWRGTPLRRRGHAWRITPIPPAAAPAGHGKESCARLVSAAPPLSALSPYCQGPGSNKLRLEVEGSMPVNSLASSSSLPTALSGVVGRRSPIASSRRATWSGKVGLCSWSRAWSYSWSRAVRGHGRVRVHGRVHGRAHGRVRGRVVVMGPPPLPST